MIAVGFSPRIENHAWICCDEKEIGTCSRAENVTCFRIAIPRAEAHGDHLCLLYKICTGLRLKYSCESSPC